MSPLEIMRARLAEQRAKSATLLAQRAAIVDKAAADGVPITPEQRTALDTLKTERDAVEADIPEYAARVVELEAEEKRELAARAARGDIGGTPQPATVVDPPVYAPRGATGHSFFRDLANRYNDPAAAERLHRSNAASLEARALGNTGATGGSGGEMSPPQWIVSEWINIIRAGRVTFDLYRKMDIPAGYSSINIPKLTGGTTTAIQSTQNTALSQTDATTSSVQTGWATIGGKQVVSQQLLDQSAINFDELILNDLAADYSKQVGAQTFSGAGTGSGTTSVVNGLVNATYGNTVTWTQASPTGSGFYGQCGKLLSSFLTSRLMAPTCWVMHPRRWLWFEQTLDSQNRPLVVPSGAAINQLAVTNTPVAAGPVGILHGYPVYLDPSISITTNTNQDQVYLLKTDDLIGLEGGSPKAEMFRETYADSVGVLFRLYNYVGTILNRHTESLGLLTGTGLTTPTFNS